MPSPKKVGESDLDWLSELRSLTQEIVDTSPSHPSEGTLEKRHESALHHLEVYQEELRAQNEELNLARENAENALKKFQFLFENSPVGFFTIDESRSIEDVNLTGGAMLGLDRSHFLGKPFFLFITPDSRGLLEAHFRAVFAGHRPRDEIRVLRSEGESFPVIIESCLAQNGLSTRKHCLTIIFDITERKKSEEDLRTANRDLKVSRHEAERANKAKSDFIAVMSHELRTPLNAILGFSDIIKSGLFGSTDVSKYTEYGRDIFDSGQHLLTLVNDVLDISKIESGEVEIKPATLELAEVFAECADIYEKQAEAKNQLLQFEVPAGLPPLYADRRAMLQMLFNLISNSIHYTPKGGDITVRGEGINSSSLRISVSDTGVGIAADRLEEVTSPFGNTNNPYVTRKHGTGLGLSITKGLIQLHGGGIRIESEENKGTTVSLLFPSKLS